MSFLPRFRSRRRDVETDVTRVAPILDSVQAARREAERELAGLHTRLQEVGDSAAFLFGDEVQSAADNNPKEKARLKELESFLGRGGMRRRYLERQVLTLTEIVSVLGTITKPITPLAKQQ